jgi:hypothetical protein
MVKLPEGWTEYRTAPTRCRRYHHATIFKGDPATMCEVICTLQFKPGGFPTEKEAIEACIRRIK